MRDWTSPRYAICAAAVVSVAASRIGDDFIQRVLGSGHVDESTFCHGNSPQRERWLTTGLETGDPTRCDTFSARDLG